MRLIDADNLELYKYNSYSEAIRNAPTITPDSLVKRGRWVRYTHSELFACTCSNCNTDAKERTPYCPWCGKIMDESGALMED